MAEAMTTTVYREVPLFLAVLVGQADGEVFIPDAAIREAGRCDLIVREDFERGGYYLSLQSARIDRSLLGRPSGPDDGSVDQDAGPGDRAGNSDGGDDTC